MSQHKTVLIRCKLRSGGFSGERTVELSPEVIVSAHKDYCFTADMRTVCPPLGIGEEIAGYVTGLLLFVTRTEDQRVVVKVELPDGQAYIVDPADVWIEKERESEWVPLEGELTRP